MNLKELLVLLKEFYDIGDGELLRSEMRVKSVLPWLERLVEEEKRFGQPHYGHDA